VRISTQVFVRVEGQRKVMEFTDPAGVTRPMEVEIDLDQCVECGALLPPGGFNARHVNWHSQQRAAA
jgi:ferredoxin-like protein FixX